MQTRAADLVVACNRQSGEACPPKWQLRADAVCSRWHHSLRSLPRDPANDSIFSEVQFSFAQSCMCHDLGLSFRTARSHAPEVSYLRHMSQIHPGAQHAFGNKGVLSRHLLMHPHTHTHYPARVFHQAQEPLFFTCLQCDYDVCSACCGGSPLLRLPVDQPVTLGDWSPLHFAAAAGNAKATLQLKLSKTTQLHITGVGNKF
eukprot:6474083-Amphidinium_carterae.2